MYTFKLKVDADIVLHLLHSLYIFGKDQDLQKIKVKSIMSEQAQGNTDHNGEVVFEDILKIARHRRHPPAHIHCDI